MSIQRLNYSTQAIGDLYKLIANKNKIYFNEIELIVYDVINLLHESIKFILPNCCPLIEPTSYNEYHHELLKLPYPICSFEAPWIRDNYYIEEGQKISKKRIALAFEHNELANAESEYFRQFLSYLLNHDKRDGIVVISIFHTEKYGWTMGASMTHIPYKDEYVPPIDLDMNVKVRERLSKNPGKLGDYIMIAEPYPLYPNIERTKKFIENSLVENTDEITMVAEACAILNCENIGEKNIPIPKGLMKKRNKNPNKPPLYEYKALSIGDDLYNYNQRSKEPLGGGKKRMHLRRGHLRRLKDGITWVRPSTINAGSKHKIDKDYILKS